MKTTRKPVRLTAIVRQSGDNLTVRIPKWIAKEMNLKAGSRVDFDTRSAILILRPHYRRKYTLPKLMKGYEGPIPYGDLARDPPVGKELL